MVSFHETSPARTCGIIAKPLNTKTIERSACWNNYRISISFLPCKIRSETTSWKSMPSKRAGRECCCFSSASVCSLRRQWLESRKNKEFHWHRMAPKYAAKAMFFFSKKNPLKLSKKWFYRNGKEKKTSSAKLKYHSQFRPNLSFFRNHQIWVFSGYLSVFST